MDPGAPAGSPAGHPATRALVEAGLLDERAAPVAVVTDLSRAHPVWSVTAPGLPPVVVKTGGPRGGPDLAVECLVYRMTVWCDEVSTALPEALHVDEDRQLLVLADVAAHAGGGSLAVAAGPHRPGPAHAPGAAQPPPDLTVVAATLGGTLGALHRATSRLPLPPGRPPMVLAALRDPRSATALGPAVGTLVDRLRATTPLAAAARELTPSRSCLVNHDLKWDNVVLDGDGRTVLVDWELAGSGDPAWDLGSLLAEHLCRGHADGPPRLDAAACRLLEGYAAAARPRPDVAQVLARRTCLAAALRTAQMAVEVAWSVPAGADPLLHDLTGTAAAVAEAVDTLTTEVASCLR
ncbi:phosphotransferase family protein [Thalassiella azotivora]